MSFFSRSVVADSPRYRADIDGLRGIAVLAVVFYHLRESLCPGGYAGVDIFFVISGFLITGRIYGELNAGNFSFRRFYEHRARRILPALAAMAFVSTIAAAVLFSPLTLLHFGWSLASLAVFCSNLYFRTLGGQGLGYFKPPPDPQPLLHTWSLSVEEQFYVLFPLFLVLCFRLRRSLLRPAIVIAFVGSLAWSIHLVRYDIPTDTPSAYYLTYDAVTAFFLLPSRTWELLLGSLLAVFFAQGLRWGWLREVAVLAGGSAIAYTLITYSSATHFPGRAALLPCIGAALVLLGGSSRPSLVGAVFRFPPLVWVGVISYSMYLWHWPLLVFYRYIYQVSPYYPPSLQVNGVLLGIALALAWLSYRFIETPFRKAPQWMPGWRILGFAAACTVVLGLAGVAMVRTNGLEQRFSAQTLELLRQNQLRAAETPIMDCQVMPIRHDWDADSDLCSTGLAAKNILFIGDSHMRQLIPFISTLQRQGKFGGEGVIFATLPGCLISSTMTKVGDAPACAEFVQAALLRARQPDVDAVFFESLQSWIWSGTMCHVEDPACIHPLPKAAFFNAYFQEIESRVHALRCAGKRVILGLPFPVFDQAIPQYEEAKIMLSRFHPLVPPRVVPPWRVLMHFTYVANDEGAALFDPWRSLCTDWTCRYEQDGVSMYVDGHHLARESMGLLEAELLRSVAAAPAGPLPNGATPCEP